MLEIPVRLREFLDSEAVDYQLIHHRRDTTAAEAAWDTGTPEDSFAKAVLVQVDGDYALAVLPASDRISEDLLRASLAADDVRIAREDEIEEVFADCELGAAPPFGNLYALPVYVSRELTEDETITFNGGTHTDAIRMSYADFARLVDPQVVALAAGEA